MSDANTSKPIAFKPGPTEQEEKAAYLFGIFKNLLADKPHIDTYTLGELSREMVKSQSSPDTAKYRVEAAFLVVESSLNTYSSGWYQTAKTKIYVNNLIEGIKSFADQSKRYSGASK